MENEFRVWDPLNRQMHYDIRLGLYYSSENANCFIIPESEQQKTIRITMNLNAVRVMRYINLDDMNGKKIYESDIVRAYRHGEEHLYVVVFDRKELGFRFMNGTYGKGASFECPTCCEDIAVMGNVYEKPNLMDRL